MKARQRARQIGNLLGFDVSAQTRIATAVSEIARNAHTYAVGSKVEYFIKRISQQDDYLEIQVCDKGPGIENVDALLTSHNSSHVGKGIRGSKNIMDRFDIISNPREGTQVTMAMCIPSASLPITQQKIAHIANELARIHPASASEELQQQNQELLQALALLNKARDELEERVQERTAQLDQTNRELQQEIKERVNIEQSLQAVTRQLNLALQAARMGTWIWRYKQGILLLDNYLSSLLGLTHKCESLNLMEFSTFIYPDDRERVQSLFQELPQFANNYEIEFRIIWPDKSIHFLASRGEIQRSFAPNEMRLTGVCWDITERRQAEEWLHQHRQELAQVTHLTAMGEMGSMLAHELNQPLTVITTLTQGCMRRIQSDNYQAKKILDMMKIVAQQAERAGQVIHRTKDFVRKGKIIHEVVAINDVIQTAITLMEYEMRMQSVHIQFEFLDKLPAIAIDKIQIEQVLLNLMRNAIEAMQEAKIKAPLLKINTLLINNTHLAVDIIDNGPGFPKEIIAKLTEPYFTTKSKGMGMGLAICRSIIEAHGGRLIANTAPGGGAWFQFTLPLVREIQHEQH